MYNMDGSSRSSPGDISIAEAENVFRDLLIRSMQGSDSGTASEGSLPSSSTTPNIKALGDQVVKRREEYSEKEKESEIWVRVKTLVKGKDLLRPLDPILGIKEFAKTHRDIGRILVSNFGIQQLNSLQRCASLHVLRGRNCTIIGGAREKRGKSLSYLIPIVSLAMGDAETLKTGWRAEDILKNPGKDSRHAERLGPVGLFICGSYSSGEKLRRHLEYLVSGTVFLTCLTNGTESHRDLKYKLMKNPEFLVVTADFALELFNKWFDLFRFERLRFLVFDDIHLLFEIHNEEVRELLRVVNHHIQKAGISSVVQTVFCGQEWNEKIASATVKVAENNVLCIGAPMEAIKYGGVHVKVHYLVPFEKLQVLEGLLDRHETGYRVIIFCKDDMKIIEECWRFCRLFGMPAQKWTDVEKGAEALQEFKNWWSEAESKDNLVIVTTDTAFKDLGIYDAHTIIHYDIPEGRQEAFGDRHMAMWGHFPDISNYETEGDNALIPKVPLTSHVFITDEDPEAHKIILKLHRMNCSNFEIHENLIAFAERKLSGALDKFPICERLLAIGQCRSAHCKSRHYFTAADVEEEPNVPRTGRLELEIVEVKDVNVYTVKLLSYYKVDTRTCLAKDHIAYANLDIIMQSNLNEYFSKPENVVTCSNLKIGMPCAIFYHNKDDPAYRNGAYVRGKIVDALLVDQFKTIVDVRVFCTDLGYHSVKNAKDVYVLPEEFQTQKSICTTLILGNLKPRAEEACFPSHSKNKTKHMIEGHIFTAKIALSVGNTVWTLPLLEHTRNSQKEWILKLNVRRDLIHAIKAADDNPKHMQILYRLCGNAGLNCDMYTSVDGLSEQFASTHFMKGGKFEWAFLPVFREDADQPLCRVLVRSVSSSTVYVQRNDFQKTLDKLNKELNEHVVSSIQEENEKYETIFESYYETEVVVAALDKVENSWNRAIITKMYKINEELNFDVYFVDFGDTFAGATMKELHPIPRKFVECLPFQSVGIRLDHLVPIETVLAVTREGQGAVDYSMKVEHYLQSLLIPPDGLKPLDVAVLRQRGYLKEGEVRVCRYYDVFALLGSKELSEYIVDEGLAQYRPTGQEEMEAFKTLMLNKWNRILDQNLDSHEEFEDDDGGFDLFYGDDDSTVRGTLLDFGCPAEALKPLSIAAELANEPAAEPPTEPAQQQQPTTSTAQAEAELPSIKATEKSAGSNCTTSTNSTSAMTAGTEVPPPVEKINAHIMTPRVGWTQDAYSVTMRIYVPDVQDYSFTISFNHRTVNFITLRKDKSEARYGFHNFLYGKVYREPSMTRNGQYITVKLIKVSEQIIWSRLTYLENEARYIRVLENQLNDADSDDEDYSTSMPLMAPSYLQKIRRIRAKRAMKRRIAQRDGPGDDDSDEDPEAILSDGEDD